MQNRIVINSELTFIKDVICYLATAVASQVITFNHVLCVTGIGPIFVSALAFQLSA